MNALLNVNEVAALLRVSRRTLETLLAANDAPGFFTVGRQRRWRHADVQFWISARAETAANQEHKPHGVTHSGGTTPRTSS